MRLVFFFLMVISSVLWGQTSSNGSTLVEDENVLFVHAHCLACHSEKLITQNRGDEGEWLQLIRWMQKTQGLWQIPEEHEKKIVAYLAKHYPPQPNRRRRPIPPELQPPLPDSTNTENNKPPGL